MATDLLNIFLTYPQCEVPPVALKDHLLSLLPDNVERMCISQELHQDGNPHLHAFVKLKTRIRLRPKVFATFFDLDYDEDGYWHPNVQKARNNKKVVQYVVKGLSNGAMQDLVEWPAPFVDAVLAKKNPKSDTVAKMIIEGKSILECFQAEPGYVGFNLQKTQYLEQWYKTVNKPPPQLDPWQELDLGQYQLNSPEYDIALWLNTNLFVEREARTPHLMLVGPTQIGKSYLIRCLKNFCRVYKCPNKGPYYSQWDDSKFDLIHIEELHAGWPISELLMFLDGQEMDLKVHGGFNRKTKNVPIIITTNQTFRQSYKNVPDDTLEALSTRVLYVYSARRVDVFPGLVPRNKV